MTLLILIYPLQSGSSKGCDAYTYACTDLLLQHISTAQPSRHAAVRPGLCSSLSCTHPLLMHRCKYLPNSTPHSHWGGCQSKSQFHHSVCQLWSIMCSYGSLCAITQLLTRNDCGVLTIQSELTFTESSRLQ